MSLYIKLFDTTVQYTAYTADTSNLILPNVSVCEDVPTTVYYNPSTPVPPTPTETRLVCKYNVTSTSGPTILFNGGGSGSGSGSGGEPPFSAMEIDGVEQSEVVNEYTFDTVGEHTVKYTLTNSTSMGDGTFKGCTGLTNVIIPNSVTSIGYQAFVSCTSLTSIDIPDSVTSIGRGAFWNCTSLTSVIIPNSVTSIDTEVFRSCTGLTNVIIPNSVTSIGDYAFYGCSGLTSVTIGSGVTSIGSSAFSNCSSLTSVTIGGGVTNIGSSAFSNCSSLTSVTIGGGVTNIGSGTFYSCNSLTSITCNATTASTIQSNTFLNVKTGGTLTAPSGSSGYDVWMQNANYYLGLYGWTKVEQ